MKPPDTLTQMSAERNWVTEGPNSGGIAGYLLYQGHLFAFRHDSGPIEIDSGMPVAEWIERYAERYPEIARELNTDG